LRVSIRLSQQDLEIFEVEIEKSLRNQLRNEIEPGYYEEAKVLMGTTLKILTMQKIVVLRERRGRKNPAKGQEQASKVY
jgi:hypothetical protein